jgi:hypothetical protein
MNEGLDKPYQIISTHTTFRSTTQRRVEALAPDCSDLRPKTHATLATGPCQML